MNEEEIRPKAIFDEYLRLAQVDTKTYFVDVKLEDGVCPACEAKGSFSFSKNGFDYEKCDSCLTLFVNPRPVASAFSKYYTESPSSEYWASTFYKHTADARREKLWKPKAKAIEDILNRYKTSLSWPQVIDIGGGYGIFAQELRVLCGQTPIVIEPGPNLATVCRENNLQVIEKFLEDVNVSDLPTGPKAFVSFELFEHLHDPAYFLRCLSVLMSSGDLFIFTTLSGTGADIQALWQDSKSVSPPHHLNFLNPHSIKILLERTGLEALEVTTPGKLDIDILVNSQSNIKDRFWRTFAATANEFEKQQWQALISASGWSSHMMIVCRKP